MKYLKSYRLFEEKKEIEFNGYLKTYEEFYFSKEQEEDEIKIGDISWINDLSVSEQVRNQIKYLMNFGPVKKFTILDDTKNKVYAVNKDFSLEFVFKVGTGRQIGDELKTITFQDWVKGKFGTWEIFKSSVKSFFSHGRIQTSDSDLKRGYTKTQMDELVSQYFDEIFKVKSTPSGVFKRARKMTDWFNNLLLTLTDKETYGRYYITWDTYWSKDGMVERGKQIPIGFHGTEDAERIETTIQNKIDGLGKNQKFKKSDLNFSFGCVNFQEQDLIKIEKFIDYGDLSFWLPDKNTDILTIDEESWKNS